MEAPPSPRAPRSSDLIKPLGSVTGSGTHYLPLADGEPGMEGRSEGVAGLMSLLS